ncbi:MAG: UDP-N-acetylglucosamine 2-epimerase, partial [Bacteroidales bacterium]
TTGIPEEYILATIHRAENTDNPENLKNIFLAFSRLNQKVVLPIHPRTRKILQASFALSANVQIIDPVGYLQMMKLTMYATRVMTDSGGLQKEAYFLKKQCITLRTETEWIETLHDQWNIVTGSDPILIGNAVKSSLPTAPQRSSFGNGKSASLIMEKLLRF